ncbi:unnamed protein product [Closterium sp. NIES-64]|nr:unnamed protein product [Closterium sp. NIES-64]
MAAEVSPSSTGLLLGVGGVTFCSLPQGPVTGITMCSSPSHGSHSSHDKSWDHPASAAQSPPSTDAFARSPAAETADEHGSDTTPTRGAAEAATAEGESQSVCQVLRWGQKKRLRYVRSQNPTTTSPPSHPSVLAGAPVSSIAAISAVRAVCKDEKKGAWEEEWRESGERAGEDACRLRVACGRGAKKGGEACEMEGAEENKAAVNRMEGESVKEEAGRGSTASGTKVLEFAYPCKVKRASARVHEPSLPALFSRGEKEARGRGAREQCDQQLLRLDDEEDFWAIRGGRLPLRPKKRSKAAEKGVQRLQPGAWLTGVCCERYQVRERKSKKKTRGLRGMSGRGSDTE